MRIADALFAGENEPTPDSRAVDLATFQEDAVRRARKILRARGGVLIADSAGLGKTYIALALIEEEVDRGGRVLVTTPAALRTMWRTALRRIVQAHGVVAVTGLGAAFRADSPATELGSDRRTAPGAALTWLSHARLSGGVDSTSLDRVAADPTLVVIDEAHGFRNPRTRRYRELARLVVGARIVMLTATPVNNTLLDLYSLIRLFAADTQFRDLGVEDLRALFRAASLQPDAQPSPAMLAVLRAIMIRRTRPLLRESQNSFPQWGEITSRAPATTDTPGMRFPNRAPPRVLRYDLEATVPNLLDDVAATLDALTFAPFRIPAYGRPRTRVHMSSAADLIRMMMLKRLESSVAALASSVDAQIAFVESFLEHLEGARLLRPADHRTLRTTDAASVQLLLDVTLDPLPRRIDAHALETDAAADLERLRALRSRLPRNPASTDAKLTRLRDLIDRELAGERVLVFTEFRETARSLWTALRDQGGIALIHGGGAFLGRGRCGRREVIERFAPMANGAARPAPREAVHTLIATDVLSEGMNLQDARHVVSYDLPWNPVRLIQRIGRIDRIGSIHDVVFVHTFLPQRGLDRLIGLLERIRIKLAAIRTGVGAENCLPHQFTAPEFFDRLEHGDQRVLDELERQDAAPFEAEERLRLAYYRARPSMAEPTGRAFAVYAIRSSASFPVQSGPRSILLAVRTGDSVRLALCTEAGQMLVDSPAAFEMLRTLIEGDNHGTTSGTAAPTEPDRDALARALRAVRLLLGSRSHDADRALEPARHHHTTQTRALSRQLLDALVRVPGGPDAQLCARAEGLLEMLARGGPVGLEHALASLRATDEAPPSAAALCDALETVFSTNRPGNIDAATSRAGAIELIGAIELTKP